MELSKRKRRWFELAEVVSKLSNYNPAVGAVIVKNGKVVSVGFNSVRDHHEKRYHGKIVRSIHAEMRAIVRARTDLRGAEIYVFSKKKDGELRRARPCPICYAMIKEAGIKKIYYTDWGNQYKMERVG